MPRLNWGSAFDIREGWINSDRDDHGQEHVGELLDGLPFEDGYFDCIVANHSLQCIRFDDLQPALVELWRVLRPGGVLRILVPDAQRAIGNWINGRPNYFPVADDVEPTLDGKALRYLFWHGDARSAFTEDSLADALQRAGFLSCTRVAFGQTFSETPEIVDLDSRENESLIIEATK